MMMTNAEETADRIRHCSNKVRLILSIIGTIVGLSAAVVFCVHFHNYNAGLWGLASGLVAMFALFVTVAYLKVYWDLRHRMLKKCMYLGCVIQLVGVCGFVAYLTLAISKNQGFIVYGHGYYLTCIWCFMTWKWGFGLFLYSRFFFYAMDISTLLQKRKAASYASLTEEVRPPQSLSSSPKDATLPPPEVVEADIEKPKISSDSPEPKISSDSPEAPEPPSGAQNIV